MNAEVLEPNGDGPEHIGDIALWVDNALRGRDAAVPRPVYSRPGEMLLTSAGSVDGPAAGPERERSVSIADRERRNMSLAEIEQCSLLDKFWGLVALKAQQEKASAKMETEDRRSQAVREKIKKEELYALWDEEDLKTREMRSVVKERLEHAALLEYLEIFYSAPSAELVIDYRWPTRPGLPQSLGQRSPNRTCDDDTKTMESKLSTNGQLTKMVHAGDATPAISAMPFDIHCPSHSKNGSTSTTKSGARESASVCPFHTFRGKKTHSLLSAQDLFVPPRHLVEPPAKVKFASAGGASGARSPTRRACLGRPAYAGLIKAVPLPPMAGAHPRDGPAPWQLPDSDNAPQARGQNAGESNRPRVLKPGAPGQPLLPSFERKFAARWSARAGETRLVEAEDQQQPAEGSIPGRRMLGVRGAGGGRGEGGGWHYSARRGVEESRSTRRRPRYDSRDRDSKDGQKAIDLIPERDEQLLAIIFGMVDTHGQGEVRLDEFMFHMTENTQLIPGH